MQYGIFLQKKVTFFKKSRELLKSLLLRSGILLFVTSPTYERRSSPQTSPRAQCWLMMIICLIAILFLCDGVCSQRIIRRILLRDGEYGPSCAA